MQIVDHDTIFVDPETELIDDRTEVVLDGNDHAHRLGKEDATEGKRQDGFIFPHGSAAWLAYHEGYREGSILRAFLAGETVRYWMPSRPTEIQTVGQAPAMGLYRCPVCKEYYNPTYGHQCPGRRDEDYVPFQMPAEAYADVLAAEDRDDWIGL